MKTEAEKQYLRLYYHKHRKQWIAYNKKTKAIHGDKIPARMKVWRAKNKSRCAANKKVWIQNNRAKYLATCRKSHKIWVLKNLDAYREARKYYERSRRKKITILASKF